MVIIGYSYLREARLFGHIASAKEKNVGSGNYLPIFFRKISAPLPSQGGLKKISTV
jgi:hypothetical protein